MIYTMESFFGGYEIMGDIEKEVCRFLWKFGCQSTVTHCLAVKDEARRLAKEWKIDDEQTAIAALLHDISAVVPDEERIAFCEAVNIEILPEERLLPLLLHQKISRIIASEIFHVTDDKILASIECHTTLRQAPSEIDMIVFLADKLAWDQPGLPPYKDVLLEKIGLSLECASLYFINYSLSKPGFIPHPWLLAAREWLCMVKDTQQV